MIKTTSIQESVYQKRLAQVQAILLRGYQKLQKEKVRTYWEVGRFVDKHFFDKQQRAKYGEEIISRLAQDIGMDRAFLYRLVKFARKFPIVDARPQLNFKGLNWTQIRQLLAVPKDEQRLLLTEQTTENNWSSAELARQIKLQVNQSAGKIRAVQSINQKTLQKLKPKCGPLSTYRIIASNTVHENSDKTQGKLFIDLGFSNYAELPKWMQGKVKEGDIFQLKSKTRLEKLPKASRKDLYTYEAFIERVVDGDTFWIQVDLGFGMWTRQKLRLRGIDADEITTNSGKKAYQFLLEKVKNLPWVTIKTTKSDKYDRYLTDLFAGDEFVNKTLLEQGLVRYLAD